MSEFKGVRVLGHTGAGQLGQLAEHRDATDFSIDAQGHLIVTRSGNFRVAAYAPGKWNGVEIVE